MFADCFIDTNILFYAALGRFSDRAKYLRAKEVIAETHFGLSGQVIQEFFVNVTRKTASPLSTAKAIEWIEALGDRPFVAIDREVVFAAAGIADRYQISYWDAALIAAAERLGAPILYTEDLNHGQTYGSVRAVNPFRAN